MKSKSNLFQILKKGLLVAIGFTLLAGQAQAYDVEYELYKNPESYGIVVFPTIYSTPELKEYLASLDFKSVGSGEAVMRYGNKHENMTYMMPKDVQEKHGLSKFIVLQVLGGQKGIMVGIFEQRYGLTLPPTTFELDGIKKNIPKTLDLFRAQDGQQKT